MVIELPNNNENTAKLAVQHVVNYPDAQAEALRNEAFEVMKAEVPNFKGGSFAFIGDHAGYYPAIIVEEAMTIGSKRKPRNWLVGRKNGVWKVHRI